MDMEMVWHDAIEEKPKISIYGDVQVLVYCSDGCINTAWYTSDGNYYTERNYCHRRILLVNWWAYLPEPPKERCEWE